MAGFSKVPRKNKKGYAWKATIKKNSRILKSKTFASKEHAKVWALSIESDFEKMEAMGSPGANITLSKLADDYMLKHTGKDISVDSKVSWWVDRIGDQYLSDITTSDIRTHLKNYLNGEALRFDGMDHNTKAKTKGIGRKRSPASRNRMKAQLSALFKFAINEEYINVNPVKGIPALSENNERIRWLSEDEKNRLMSACQDSNWSLLYLLVFLAISTGARRGELLRLKWDDINFKDRSVILSMTKKTAHLVY
jgi:integrase